MYMWKNLAHNIMNKEEFKKYATEQSTKLRNEFPWFPAVIVYATIIKNKFNFDNARKELQRKNK